jgi:hypothetical protein
MRSGHTGTHFEIINRGTPVLLMVLSSIILISFTEFFKDELMRWGFALRSQPILVDEDLPNFFKTVSLQQAEMLTSEFKNIREKYGIEICTPKYIQNIRKFGMPKKAM